MMVCGVEAVRFGGCVEAVQCVRVCAMCVCVDAVCGDSVIYGEWREAVLQKDHLPQDPSSISSSMSR